MLTVEICMGTSCHLMGSQDLLAVIEALPAEQRQLIEVKGVTCFKKLWKRTQRQNQWNAVEKCNP